MHILRINIFDHLKIVINSLEVYLGITRQHAQVGHKTIIIFSHKSHLGRFCINGKQFIKKDLLHNFVQLLAQELVMTSHTTYLKIGYRGLMDFDLWQIYFFTFLFFMLKITRIRPCEYNKSCSTLRQESNEIEFAFFLNFLRFSTHFTSFSKVGILLKIHLAPRPLERIDSLRYALGSRIKP
jgi:hypothetical protein